ncbi:MAG: FAD-binding oxidoreductase [Bacteroidota bacterium]|nr:FAD-binding oxidoreductase [Bacteroidota bacterium]
MSGQLLKIKSINHVTHDVLRIVMEKPKDIHFNPGQAADISINKEEWEKEIRPFTFTCLPADNFLEFTIKTYPARNGVTNQLLNLKPVDELILHEVFGSILYKDEGVFIAGGAGVTPFISILRELKAKNLIGENKLVFSNKTKSDIIYEDEFKNLLGKNFINILSEETVEVYPHGHISEEFLKLHIDNFNKHFYVCGPPPMMDAVLKQLKDLGVLEDLIITEQF